MPSARGRNPFLIALAVAAAGLVVLAVLVCPHPGNRWVVVLGIDGFGWWWLATAAAAVLISVVLVWLTVLLVGARSSWWAFATQIAVTLLLGAFWLVGGYGLLLFGFLSFKNTYREIGAVDGAPS